MEKAKSNKKFLFTIISLSIAVVCALGGIIGIWAASSQTVGSTFTVTYDIGKNVAIAVGASAQTCRDTNTNSPIQWFTPSNTSLTTNSNGLYQLNAIEQTDLGLSLQGSDFDLNYGEVKCITFYYQNISSATIRATLTNNSTSSGMSVRHFVQDFAEVFSGAEPAEGWNMLGDISSSVGDMYACCFLNSDAMVTLDSNNSTTFEIQPNVVMCYTIEISVDESTSGNASAYYISNAENGISCAFVNVDTTT